jgi:hypothetical protein
LNTKEDLDNFIKNVNVSINLFRKCIENKRTNDQTCLMEYGSFLYSMHSYCSRQIKLVCYWLFYKKSLKTESDYKNLTLILKNNLVKIFEDDSMASALTVKKIEYLKLALDTYKRVLEMMNGKSNEDSLEKTDNIEANNQESNSVSSVEKSNQNEATEKSTKSNNKNDHHHNSHDNSEEWLIQYMLGKIKEKLVYGLLECLEHYKAVICFKTKIILCPVKIFKKSIYFNSSPIFIWRIMELKYSNVVLINLKVAIMLN